MQRGAADSESLVHCVHPSRGMAVTQGLPAGATQDVTTLEPCGFRVKSRDGKLKLGFSLWRRKRSVLLGQALGRGIPPKFSSWVSPEQDFLLGPV